MLELVKLRPSVIRGNASEIMALAGAAGAVTRGVDSTSEPEEALEVAKQLALDTGCVIAISGAVDLVRCLCQLAPPLIICIWIVMIWGW